MCIKKMIGFKDRLTIKDGRGAWRAFTFKTHFKKVEQLLDNIFSTGQIVTLLLLKNSDVFKIKIKINKNCNPCFFFIFQAHLNLKKCWTQLTFLADYRFVIPFCILC